MSGGVSSLTRTRLYKFPCLTGKIQGFLAILAPNQPSFHRNPIFLLMFLESHQENKQGKLNSDQGIRF